jgi:hypothetical protein
MALRKASGTTGAPGADRRCAVKGTGCRVTLTDAPVTHDRGLEASSPQAAYRARRGEE